MAVPAPKKGLSQCKLRFRAAIWGNGMKIARLGSQFQALGLTDVISQIYSKRVKDGVRARRTVIYRDAKRLKVPKVRRNLFPKRW